MRLVVVTAMLFLAACAPRYAAKWAEPDARAQTEAIYVATTRALDATGQAFGASRATGLNYFRIDVSVPPTHETGQIEWAKGVPDTAREFAVTGSRLFPSGAAMARAVQSASPGAETLVFVHGYNNTLSESMYRLAQIQADFDTRGPSVLYSWPSAGDPRGYVYDRDSVLFARDDLEDVLQALTRARGEKVFLLAHSAGSHLVMEVLRQAALRGDRRLLNRVSGVVLISPDIDPDLFRRQAEAIGRLPQPFLIFTSRQDRALSLAGLITGRKPRLGVIDGPDKVAGLNVQVVDFTALGDGPGLGHFVPATSPSAVSVLRGLIAQAEAAGAWAGDYVVLQ